jgi:hypothetical protein
LTQIEKAVKDLNGKKDHDKIESHKQSVSDLIKIDENENTFHNTTPSVVIIQSNDI